MADSAVVITAGTGTNIDTRTEATNGNHRQVVVLGDPATNAGVAPVDGTAGLKVDLGADNDVTVTGTVTANLSATDNAVLDAIEADTTTLAGAVSGTEVQVDVLTMPTTTVQATNLDIRDLSSASDTVTVHGDVGVLDQIDLTNSNPAAVAIVDGNGDQITSFGGGTQYTEDAAAAANPVGTAMILVREDGRAGSLTTADGDNVAARGNNKGELYVKTTDSDALLTTIDADTSTLAGAVAGSEMQVDVVGSLPAGTNAIGKLAANSGVDIGDTDVTSVIPGTGATNLGKAIDTATGATDTGVLSLATRDDALSALTPAEGDNVQLRTDANGALWVIPSGTVTVTSSNLDVQSGGADLATTTQAAAIQTAVELIDDTVYTDDTATHSTGTSKGIGMMGVAVPTDTSISANDIGMIAMSTDRRQFVDATLQLADTDISATNALPTKGVPSDIDINGSNANHADKYYTNSGAVTDGIVWSPAAGKRWHVLTLYINVSAAATVTLEDDLAGGDVARWKGELAANSGVVLTYDKEHPFCSGEDAADLIITTSAGNVYVQAVGYEV